MQNPNFLPFIEKMALENQSDWMKSFPAPIESDSDFQTFHKWMGFSSTQETLVFVHLVLKTMGGNDSSSNQILEDLDLGIADWEWIHPLFKSWTQKGIIHSKRKFGVLFENVSVVNLWMQRVFNEEMQEEVRDEQSLFFAQFNIWIQAMKNKVISMHTVKTELGQWMETHGEIDFVKKVRGSWNLDLGQTVMLLILVDQQVRHQAGLPLDCICDVLAENDAERFDLKYRLNKADEKLFKEQLIQLRNANDPFSPEEFVATPKAMEVFYPTMKWDKIKSFSDDESERSIGKMLSWKNIKEEKLFFNDEEQNQLNTISKLLSSSSYGRVTKALKKKNLGEGITVMLYGQPGTGKTASVLQWAKKNKRSVFLVDISQVRGKYFGDTERNAKRIFDDYYAFCKTEENTPILLFNEADGVIQKRLDVSNSIEASLNAMQNILLQEMENFKGILVATTNLNKNMDDAFERRFLWKVQIGHPNADTQDKMMWSAFKGEVNRQEVRMLSGQYSLTGGQLMNVRRKFLLETISHPRMNRYACLSELCQRELNYGTNVSRKEIGF